MEVEGNEFSDEDLTKAILDSIPFEARQVVTVQVGRGGHFVVTLRKHLSSEKGGYEQFKKFEQVIKVVWQGFWARPSVWVILRDSAIERMRSFKKWTS